ncbi:MAG: glycosyltransferase family 2 protein [Saprospiraceae bacterium]
MIRDISFAISSYNRADDLLDLLHNIMALDDFEEFIEDVVIINNGSTSSYAVVEDFVAQLDNPRVKYHLLPTNLGATGGKNKAFELCKGRYVVMPDDDCLMEDKNCLSSIVREFERTDTDREIAIVVFKLVYHINHQIQWSGFPHKNFKKYAGLSSFQTYFFPGGACAFKRSCIEKTGFYTTDISFAQEEYDLALKLIGAGYCFIYTDKVTVLHKESPLERFPPPKRSMLNWVNKSRISYKYLPKKYYYSTAFFWAMQHLRESKGDYSYFIPGIKQIMRIPSTTVRAPLSKEAFAYLKKVEARLWY